jgi:hypothetical protein
MLHCSMTMNTYSKTICFEKTYFAKTSRTISNQARMIELIENNERASTKNKIDSTQNDFDRSRKTHN